MFDFLLMAAAAFAGVFAFAALVLFIEWLNDFIRRMW
jgi:hypothetical protein